MVKRKLKTWFIGGGWKRVSTPIRKRYFHDGKIVSEHRFTATFHRHLKKWRRKAAEAKKETPPEPEVEKPLGEREFNLCEESERQRFYDQIKKDKRSLRDKISDEDFDDVRIIFEMGWDVKSKTKRGSLKRIVVGMRKFKSLTRFKRFLGIANYKYPANHEGTPVDWTPEGACKYKKRAELSRVRTRGERTIGKKKYFDYEFQES